MRISASIGLLYFTICEFSEIKQTDPDWSADAGDVLRLTGKGYN